MKRWMLALVTALVTATGAAYAETPPSMWDRAKQPEVQDEYELHVAVQRIINIRVASDDPNTMLMVNGQRLRALAMLRGAGAETSKNPLLRFDLGAVYEAVEQYQKAAETLKAAMSEFPSHPLAHEKRSLLAEACGHIGDHECESKMYRLIIADTTDPEDLSRAMLNLAEADMHAHNLKEAIEGYRESLRLCSSFQSYYSPALAQWGIAVAMDRSGEVKLADEAASLALGLANGYGGINLLTSRGVVFFFPEYEVAWYQSLTFAAQARRAAKPRERLSYWLLAERTMGQWVRGGERTKDFWLPIAKTRLEAYSKERKRAEADEAKAPADPEDEGPSITPVQPPIMRPKIMPPPPIPKGPNPKSGDVHI